MASKKKITITEKQAIFLIKVIEMGLDQHKKFLQHDEWDYGMTRKEKYDSMWLNREFEKGIKLLKEKRRNNPHPQK